MVNARQCPHGDPVVQIANHKSQIRSQKCVPAFLDRHDFVYEAAPLRWSDGLPLGNASIGAVIWGDGGPLKLTLDSCELWDLRSPRIRDKRYSYAHFKKLYQEGRISEIKNIFDFRQKSIVPTRLPGPRVELGFGGKAKTFKARLRLATAGAEGCIGFDKGSARWHAYVAAGEDVLILKVLPGDHPRARLRVRLDHLSDAACAALRRRRFPKPQRGKGLLYQAIPENGGYLVAWRRIPGKRNGDTFLITLIKGEDKSALTREARRRLARASQRLATLRRGHVGWWRSFWQRSFLTVPDNLLESLFYAEIYKLGCNARPDAALPVALQGVWSPDGEMPPWHGDYHLDLNVQFSYWPAYTSNRLDCAGPLYAWATRLLPTFRKECRRFFGCDGAFAPCALGPNGERVLGYETTEQWPGNGAWLAHLFWLHYLYTRDESFLREQAYPFMRAFMQLYANLLDKARDGRYHLSLSNSPEYGEDRPESWGADTTCDLALIRFLCGSLLHSVEKLKLDDPEAETWRDIMRRLTPYPSRAAMTTRKRKDYEARLTTEDQVLDATGGDDLPRALFVMRDVPYAFSHRHLSHLMAIHPLALLTVEDGAEARAIIRDSIRALWVRGEAAWAGFTDTWASALASRARMPAMAVRLLREFAANWVTANTFCLNADHRLSGASRYLTHAMTLESGFSMAGALMEMLLQSWGEKIRVFPAVPLEWRDAAFYGLRGEGAFLVSARLEKGEVQWVEIHSEKGLPCRVENPFASGPVFLEDVETGRTRRLRGSVLGFATRPNSTWRLYRRRPAQSSLNALERAGSPERPNPFGVKLTHRLA